MIPVLPRQQLLGLHREVCALRGLSWGKRHSIINYVFNHGWEHLINYHKLVISEMKKRTYKPNPTWNDFYYRGKRCLPLDPEWMTKTGRRTTYPEHHREYLKLCIRNLTRKLKAAPAGKYNENEVYRFYSWVQENNFSIE